MTTPVRAAPRGCPPSLTEEEIRNWAGEMAQAAENYLEASQRGMPLALRCEALTQGLQEVRDKARCLYCDLGGEDVWGLM